MFSNANTSGDGLSNRARADHDDYTFEFLFHRDNCFFTGKMQLAAKAVLLGNGISQFNHSIFVRDHVFYL